MTLMIHTGDRHPCQLMIHITTDTEMTLTGNIWIIHKHVLKINHLCGVMVTILILVDLV